MSDKKPVAELEGSELDYWAAKALELPGINKHPNGIWYSYNHDMSGYGEVPPYSESWQYGGPVLDRVGVCLLYSDEQVRVFVPNTDGIAFIGSRKSTLMLAMRCFVASKYGEYVDGSFN
jgi:hypothetical protein